MDVQAFVIVPPIVEMEDSIIIEFMDETEPAEFRKYRLFLQKHSLDVAKMIVYRPNLSSWQDISSMISPFYLASLKNTLLLQAKEHAFLDKQDIS